MDKYIYLKNAKDVYFKNIFILIKNEYIEKISENEININELKNIEIIDLKEKILMPGIIDVHTHMREPGFTHKEDLKTASKACLKGGITTFFDMPNTMPTTSTLISLEEKKEIASKKSLTNYYFHFGASKNNNVNEIKKVLKDKKARSVKLFLNVTTGEMLIENDEILDEIFKVSPLILVHAENEMIDKAIEYARKNSNEIYICHVSSKEEMEKIIKAKKEMETLKIYSEITPHHLFLNEEIREENEKNKMLLRMKPELKSKKDNEFLWEAIKNSYVDTIATDHAPHLISEKLDKITFGMPGVETSLSLMLDAVNNGKIDLVCLQKLMCENPAKIFKINKRGKLLENYYADIIAIDLSKEWIVSKKDLESKAAWSPYENWKLRGKNILTIINGVIKYKEDKIINEDIYGKEVEIND